MSGPEQPPSLRCRAVDALRGVAIVSMLAANLAGPCLRAPHPLWLRAFGSFAAPAFVLLAGMMTSSPFGQRSLLRLLRRAGLLLAVAAAIDVVCWGIEPFQTFDVLYLLGLSLPLAGLCARLPGWQNWLLVAVILAAAPLLQARLGYGPLLPEHLAEPWPTWRRLLVDGWFPLFPWLGVALLGAGMGRLGLAQRPRRELGFVAAGLFALGVVGFAVAPPRLVTREGYSELFYPVTWQYLSLALGAVGLALVWLQSLEPNRLLDWLESLGQCSLELYVLHVALIAFWLDDAFAERELAAYLGLYAALLFGLSALAWLRLRYRSRWAPRGAFDRGNGAPRAAR